ncbi:hypothetical protein K458DRAFT_156467 [Lentithecium fluviatile CBS 122367]|uniref:F-box domain-containing protein n=1 Tax=Lentithecium fluviatile CBS 122367 TaxID=1168545 RepID=A0A6G1IIT2_9PLEO|nr:hypothetical protein K458DRAFT_156467 [Lentithecium fluviatile CBS 122367]
MPSLLTLPRELRDEIIGLVVASNIPLPADRTRRRARDYRVWSMDHVVFHPSSPAAYRPSSLSLLLTSKQIYAETLSRLEQAETDLEVDVAFLDMAWLWPTYRVIPPRTERPLKRMDVNISLVQSEEEARTVRMRVTYDTFWGFAHRLLVVGPIRDAYKPKGGICVKELRLNLDMDKNRTGNYMFSEVEIPMRTVEGHANLTENHRWLFGSEASVAETWVKQLATFTVEDIALARTWKPMAAMALRRIGRVVFCIDGKERSNLDLGDFVSESHVERLPSKDQIYYENIRDSRKRNGL